MAARMTLVILPILSHGRNCDVLKDATYFEIKFRLPLPSTNRAQGFGEPLNVPGYFNSRPCFLVLDHGWFSRMRSLRPLVRFSKKETSPIIPRHRSGALAGDLAKVETTLRS
jgi:hypothetical protein